MKFLLSGICSCDETDEVDIIIGYDSVRKANDDVCCTIKESDTE